MKTKSFLMMLILSVAAFAALAADTKNTFTIGSTLENFTLPDTNGKEQSFESLKGKNGTIIVFLSVQCPVVKAYDERIAKLAEEYQAKGINVIGINSNATESPMIVKTHAEKKYKFPVLKDKDNIIADKLTAYATPEMFFFDTKNKLVYHGAIDNDRSGGNISTNFLRDALEEHLAGKSITKADTKAIGCTIKRAGM